MTFRISNLAIKAYIFLTTVASILLLTVPAFAAGGASPIEDPAADATNRIAGAETQYRWFYWPGWAFLGLTIVILGLVAFFFYRNVYVPQYKGKKVKA